MHGQDARGPRARSVTCSRGHEATTQLGTSASEIPMLLKPPKLDRQELSQGEIVMKEFEVLASSGTGVNCRRIQVGGKNETYSEEDVVLENDLV